MKVLQFCLQLSVESKLEAEVGLKYSKIVYSSLLWEQATLLIPDATLNSGTLESTEGQLRMLGSTSHTQPRGCSNLS